MQLLFMADKDNLNPPLWWFFFFLHRNNNNGEIRLFKESHNPDTPTILHQGDPLSDEKVFWGYATRLPIQFPETCRVSRCKRFGTFTFFTFTKIRVVKTGFHLAWLSTKKYLLLKLLLCTPEMDPFVRSHLVYDPRFHVSFKYCQQ